MLYYLIAAAFILHTYFWGAGLSLLTLPRPWLRFWWVFAPGFGYAAQSAVVWLAAHGDLAGTNSYAIWSQILPVLLLVAAWIRLSQRSKSIILRPGRQFLGVLLISIIAGWTLLSPLTKRGAWTLTSSSLGSCDHADYAAGARVLQEFSRSDRLGFLGLPEVTKVGSTEFFFDYVVRQNHFTPPALIAHTAAILELRPHQLVSIAAVVFVLLNLPLVFFLTRSMTGLKASGPLFVTTLYGLSPLVAYGVHHGALAQSLAAHGIALLTITAYGASLKEGRAAWSYAPLAFVAVWLLAGSYNFILTVAFAPAAAWLLAISFRRGSLATLWRTGLMYLGVMGACIIIFWGRFAGLAERFALFKEYDFGWPVAILTPEGWLGLIGDVELTPWPSILRWITLCLVGALAVAGLIRTWRLRSWHGSGAIVLALPATLGWAILVWEAGTRVNASYDSYKLLMVFYPGLLAGILTWVAGMAGKSTAVRWLVRGAMVFLIVANVGAGANFRTSMAQPPLRVDGTILQLARLEREGRVTSLNMKIDRFWSRLWANALLLKKPQYFSTHTYEARRNTDLLGEWDLSDGLIRCLPIEESDFLLINDRFHVVRNNAKGRIWAELGTGWYDREGPPQVRWRWNSGDGRILLTNHGKRAQPVRLHLRLRSVDTRTCEIWLNESRLGSRLLDPRESTWTIDGVMLPPGRSTLRLYSPIEPAIPERDKRPLSVALYNLDVRSVPSNPDVEVMR